MAVKKIDIETFMSMTGIPVIDVRSPLEYTHAHIPGALSLPLFSDEERKQVGTTYKQISREQAIKIGLDYFGPKMRRIVEQIEELLQNQPTKQIVVHCWRGGMRSAAIAWLLDLYGFNVYTIIGGYKSFRNWAINFFSANHNCAIVGGYTGSAKTEIIQQLAKKNETIIDLEGLANHKGSAFGAIGQPPQPSQEMFENLLAIKLHYAKQSGDLIWMEDESQRIGIVNIPAPLWTIIRSKPVYFVKIPFEIRLQHIQNSYGKLNKGDLAAAIIRIKKRLGGLETKTALSYLAEDNTKECFRILLTYYDKLYDKALQNRPEPKPETVFIEPATYEHSTIAEKILETKLAIHGNESGN